MVSLIPSHHSHTSSRFSAIIVAAGKGLRAGQTVPKQFADWKGKPLLRHSAEALSRAGASPIVIAIPEGSEKRALTAVEGIENIHFVTGGATRQQSVRAALEALEHIPPVPAFVLIHDAARPDLPQDVIDRVLEALNTGKGAIPVLPVVDSLTFENNGKMGLSAEREKLRRVQTPQGFHFDDILGAHRDWSTEPDAGDDAQVMQKKGAEITLVSGDERLKKITFSDDFKESEVSPPSLDSASPPRPPVRVGTGFDVHRFATGRDLWLCGLQIPYHLGLSGHSDADVALHAIVDALLGAIGAGDIGQHFPPTDATWRGAPSSHFLDFAIQKVSQAGYIIGNIDLTIICEAPKIGPYREAMQNRLEELARLPPGRVNVKATTTEGLGFTGRNEGIAAQASISLYQTGLH
ncbi:MAG: bifunctional 2-C-methyl-D-erythritol 4-phosphate cytidylyltransferase/2-C-methyl-D-erythritol 2,4-cyclodiphosphate synthase [Sphingomonadaceae bacterium]